MKLEELELFLSILSIYLPNLSSSLGWVGGKVGRYLSSMYGMVCFGLWLYILLGPMYKPTPPFAIYFREAVKHSASMQTHPVEKIGYARLG